MLSAAERRGALVVLLLLTIGAGWDLWRAAHPRFEADRTRGLALPTAASRPAAGPDSARHDAPGAPVDLNRAGLAELDALPGIGPVLARRILEHRERHGPFRRVEELRAVRGVGPRLLERLRPRVTIDSANASR